MKQITLNHGYAALVDDEDFESLNDLKWHIKECNGRIYASHSSFINQHHKGIYMHRKIMRSKNPKISVDHIDGNGLNNQKSNLRECTHQQNLINSKLSSKNTSGFRGVYWQKDAKKFMAYVKKDYKMYNLGLFLTAKEAALVRDKKAKELNGDFAVMNFP